MERIIVGTCMKMCPDTETNLREKQKLIHHLEMKKGTKQVDRTRTVKCFRRSGAGQKTQNPSELRPPNILLHTVEYLLDKIITDNDYHYIILYNFINDRLRCVYQDMVVQDLSGASAIGILQPIARFYAYSAYELCDEPVINYDPVLNNKQLLDTLKKLLCLYDDCDDLQATCERKRVPARNYDAIFINDRSQIEALYILHNLGHTECLIRGIGLPKRWRTKEVRTALKISFEYLRGNFYVVFRLIETLPPLLKGIVGLHLPEIRRKAFITMSSAYICSNVKYPISKIKAIMLYSDLDELMSDLDYYEISCDKECENVKFSKNSSPISKKPVTPRKEKLFTDALKQIASPKLILEGAK